MWIEGQIVVVRILYKGFFYCLHFIWNITIITMSIMAMIMPMDISK